MLTNLGSVPGIARLPAVHIMLDAVYLIPQPAEK